MSVDEFRPVDQGAAGRPRHPLLQFHGGLDAGGGGPRQRIVRERDRLRGEFEGAAQQSRPPCRRGCRGQHASSALPVLCEPCGTFIGGVSVLVAAAFGRAFQCGRRFLIRPGGGRGQLPGAQVRVVTGGLREV
ncbi:hypothetical protein GCM10010191_78630 [Actinomadura vinacea]|uniref:Uncharacterized protein n=1 Tax=Actinomadura vinacea TaxID=115336 RepID=A0ABN3K4L2_9ACTN